VGAARDARAPLAPGRLKLAFAELNGTTIAYDTAGDGAPVVLMHAGVGDRRLWDGQMDAFSARHRVVRLDMRGFGESAIPGMPFSYVDDLRALLDHLGIERAAVVGNSFGGRVSLDFALEHPERLTALVLVDSALSGWEGSAFLDEFDEEEETLLDGGQIDAAVELNLRTWLDGPEREAAPVAPDVRARVAEMQRSSFETLVRAYEGSPEPGPVTWADPPAATRLGEVSAPTLVIVGARDQPDFRAISARLAAEIPGAESVELETAHLPALERPDEFNRIVLDFLSRAAA
jgi:pimeloyl-ACP methyl ester carboxylesterase